jgi:hypothetical protein
MPKTKKEYEMKKLLSLFLMMAMIGNGAFAQAPQATSHSELIARTFNQFRYKMTVDVNPNDSGYRSKAVNDFKKNIALIQTQGVTPLEIMDYMRSNVLDPSVKNDFDRMLSTMDPGQVSGEEAGNMAMKFMAAKYQSGASYSGGGSASVRAALVVLGVVAIGVATYYLYQYLNGKFDRTHTKTVTDTCTDTSTDTMTNTDTGTDTNTDTITDDDILCCNGVSGHIVSAKRHNGCTFGAALYEVSSEEECVKLGPIGHQ